jgi:hypothetical protein
MYLRLVAEGKVNILNEQHEIQYSATLTDFKTDYGSPFPINILPEGHMKLGYSKGVSFKSSDGGSEKVLGDLVWAEGDAIIADLPSLIPKMEAREAQVWRRERRRYD